VRYDPWLFAASVVVAVVLAIIALQVRFWIGRARATAGASTVVQEILSASILGFAVAAMHYTAMASTYCFAGSGPRVPGTMAHGIFATVTTLVASLVLIMAIAAVIFDRRVKLEIAARNEAKEKERLTGELLFQSQKMEAVGQLTGGVAHDFNNILMVLLAHVEALREDEGVDRRLHGRLDKMASSIERAASLIRQLMAFSRRQVLSPSETMLNELVSSTGAMLRRSLGEHVVLREKLEAGLWSTNVDRAQLEAALINLCVNARDAMPDGGELAIETRNVTLDERYAASHADVVAGDYVLLSVTDTGTGMTPDTLRRVFEPFFTTKEVGKGTGLGLSMVYGFMHQSNGHVDISSELGEGTTVRLYFRRSTDVATAVTGRRAAMPQGNERILVVEDEEAVRKLVVEELRSLGYNVVHVAHAEEALDRLRNRGAFDLMLTDVMMPGRLNGKALADETAQYWPDMRVVFMSGYSENALQNDGRLDVGVRLLGKPFRKAELAIVVREALADEPPPPPEAARAA
jgi:signal transduction histidine kinase/CheY-like chemotaxis protein